MPFKSKKQVFKQHITTFAKSVVDFFKQLKTRRFKNIGYVGMEVLGSAVVIIW